MPFAQRGKRLARFTGRWWTIRHPPDIASSPASVSDMLVRGLVGLSARSNPDENAAVIGRADA